MVELPQSGDFVHSFIHTKVHTAYIHKFLLQVFTDDCVLVVKIIALHKKDMVSVLIEFILERGRPTL